MLVEALKRVAQAAEASGEAPGKNVEKWLYQLEGSRQQQGQQVGLREGFRRRN